jgi:hypothetical protein
MLSHVDQNRAQDKNACAPPAFGSIKPARVALDARQELLVHPDELTSVLSSTTPYSLMGSSASGLHIVRPILPDTLRQHLQVQIDKTAHVV